MPECSTFKKVNCSWWNSCLDIQKKDSQGNEFLRLKFRDNTCTLWAKDVSLRETGLSIKESLFGEAMLRIGSLFRCGFGGRQRPLS